MAGYVLGLDVDVVAGDAQRGAVHHRCVAGDGGVLEVAVGPGLGVRAALADRDDPEEQVVSAAQAAPAARDRAAVRVKERFLPDTLKVWACRPLRGSWPTRTGEPGLDPEEVGVAAAAGPVDRGLTGAGTGDVGDAGDRVGPLGLGRDPVRSRPARWWRPETRRTRTQ